MFPTLISRGRWNPSWAATNNPASGTTCTLAARPRPALSPTRTLEHSTKSSLTTSRIIPGWDEQAPRRRANPLALYLLNKARSEGRGSHLTHRSGYVASLLIVKYKYITSKDTAQQVVPQSQCCAFWAAYRRQPRRLAQQQPVSASRTAVSRWYFFLWTQHVFYHHSFG